MKRMNSRNMILITFVAAIVLLLCIHCNSGLAEDSYEYAMFPNGVVYVSQTAYGSYSHSGKNVTDIVPDGDVKAPFTGTIRYKDDTWGYVILESDDLVHYADGSLAKMCVGFMHDNSISDLYVGKKINQGQAFYQKGVKSPKNNVTGAHVHIVCMRGGYTSTLASNYSSRGNVYIYDAFWLASNTRITKSGYSSSLWKVKSDTPAQEAVLAFHGIAYPNPYKISSSGYVWGSGSGTITAKDGLASVVFNIYDKNGNRVAHYGNNQNVKTLTLQSVTSKIKMSDLTVEGPSTFEVIATDVNGHKLERSVIFTASKSQSTVNKSFSDTYVEPTLVSSVTWGNSLYQLYKSTCTWNEASAFASAHGGHLATITSSEENGVLANLLSAQGIHAYLGGYHNGSSFVWETSESMSYSNWTSGEPNLTASREKYMTMYGTSTNNWSCGQWNDATANSSCNAFIIEKPANTQGLVTGLTVFLEGDEHDSITYFGLDDNWDGAIIKVTAIVEPAEAVNKEIAWTISNTDIFSLDHIEKSTDGSVIEAYFRFCDVGETNVTLATTDGSGISKTIRLENLIGRVEIPEDEINLSVGDSFQIVPALEPRAAKASDLVWSSSNTQVATVDGNGNVKALAGGTTTITAQTQGHGGALDHSPLDIDTCTVNVAAPILAFNEISYPSPYKIDATNGYVWRDGSGTITARDGLTSVIFNIYDKNGERVAHYENNQSVNTLTMKSITSKIKMSDLTTAGTSRFEIVATDVNGRMLEASVLFTASTSGSTTTKRLSRTYMEPTLVTSTEYGESRYELYRASFSWAHASAYAQTQGGTLASVTSSGENAAILNMLTSSGAGSVWIGGSYNGSQYVWADGESMTYTNWGTSQPDHAASAENYMEMASDGKWNDCVINANKNYFVVKKPRYDKSGFCGDNATWTYSDHVLTISGTGAMWDDYGPYDVPWYVYADDIHYLSIDSGITHLGNYVFRELNNLVDPSFVVPNGVISLGSEVFTFERSFNYYVPESVTSIGISAFGAGSCTVDENNPNYSSINGVLYNKDKTILVFCPKSTESIVIPSSVERIESYAFYGCSSLTDVSIPTSVTSIGDAAFCNMFSLEDIVVPDSVKTIGSNNWPIDDFATTIISCYEGSAAHTYAVENEIPYILLNIGGTCGDNATWSYSDGVLTISGTGKIADYSSREERPWNNYASSIHTVIVESGITHIGQYCFEGFSSLSSVSLPDSVTYMAYRAFADCDNLQSILLPSSLTSLGGACFCDCSGMESIEIPDSVTFVGYFTFYACDSLRSVKLSTGLDKLSYGMFGNCPQLESIVIPDGVKSIGYRTFEGCQSLTNIIIPASVTGIDVSTNQAEEEVYQDYNTAFNNCGNVVISCWDGSSAHTYAVEKGIPYVIIGGPCGDNATWSYSDGVLTISGTGAMYNYSLGESPWYDRRDAIQRVTVSDGIATIGDYAFLELKYATEIRIPNTVHTFGKSSFRQTGISNINIPFGITEIPHDCFDGSQISSVVLPESVSLIHNRAFEDCHNLSTITIPASVTVIDVGTETNPAFYQCENLTIRCYAGTRAHLYAKANGIPYILLDVAFTNPDFTLPTAAKTIESEAFSGITAKRVKLPEGVTKIASKAFANCPNLVAIYIPDGCTNIAADAFEGVSGLTIFCHEGSYAEFYTTRHQDFDCVIVP